MTERILEPTPVELARANAVLQPAGQLALQQLREAPETPFSLIRPLTNPDAEVILPMQQDIAEIMYLHEARDRWISAGVRLPEYIGATLFDGEPATIPHTDSFRNITPYALAAKMCAALPATASQPVTATVEKICATAPIRACVHSFLGLTGDVVYEEFAAAYPLGQSFTLPVPPAVLAARAPVNLTYIQKDGKGDGNSYVPTAAIRQRILRTIPEGTTVELAPVRLFIHTAGTSPYTKIKG